MCVLLFRAVICICRGGRSLFRILKRIRRATYLFFPYSPLSLTHATRLLRLIDSTLPHSLQSSPSLWMYALLQCVTTWLQAQGITRPIAVTSGAAALLHPLLNWLFIKPCGLGAIGSAVATALTQAIWLTMLIVYIVWYGVAAQTGLAWPSRKELRQTLWHDPWPFLQVRDGGGIGGVS